MSTLMEEFNQKKMKKKTTNKREDACKEIETELNEKHLN